MSKYICNICGFIYDESLGLAQSGISPGTLWDDVPIDWKCPLCGAAKSEFRQHEAAPESTKESNNPLPIDLPEDLHYTTAELSALFTNLAKGWEKQYQPEMAAHCNRLADYYKKRSPLTDSANLLDMKVDLENDLTSSFVTANDISATAEDRGALRALKWAEQVSRMNRSHLSRLESEGTTFIESTNVYVCEICGFLYVGDDKPEVCPVCKVPSMKMTKIERGA